MSKLNRRIFLRRSIAAATLASTPGLAFSQVVGAAAPFDDYRALVCIFLHGGNDSFNMLVPRSNAEYGVYAASRQNLAIAQAELLPIDPRTADGAQYGLHPAMAGLQALFEAGQLAFVANVGPLIEPTSKEQYLNKSVLLPPQLFSHNDQQDQWNSLKGRRSSATGWAGRIADVIRDRVAGQRMATNASLSGTNLFQTGAETFPYVMGPEGPLTFDGFWSPEHRMAFEGIVDADYDSVYERGFAAVQRRAIDAADTVTVAIDSAPAFSTPFPGSELGTQLHTVARLIAVRDTIAMQRQIFLVEAGGFDSHDNQNAVQPGLFADVSESVAAFHAAMAEIGVADGVTSFTQSDFGRTLTSNGDGTDHAWGGVQLVAGGAVRGRDLYGVYPRLEIGGPDDVDGGRMIPTTSADQYAATLAKWFGIPDTDLEMVAPSLGNFSVRDLGFLG